MTSQDTPTFPTARRRWPALRPALAMIGGCWLLLGQAPAQAQFPNLARGFSPSGMFDVGGIDVVNGFNGNMVIRIPIGKAYPVGGTMGSYSFSLIYNSKVWDFHSRAAVQCTGSTATVDTLAEPSPHDNAGLGWRFSLGRLGGDPTDEYLPPPPSSLAYHGMDGSEHYLFNYLAQGQGGSVQQTGMEFSNDGSYLRYSSAARTIEFPDGNVHTFDANGFPTSIKDPFGNGLTITYSTTDPSCPGNASGPGTAWQISDGYRTHKVCLVPTGYASPEQTQVIDHIDLAAFGTNAPPATYKFFYNDADTTGFHPINLVGTGTKIRGCTGTDPGWNPPVYVLTALQLPDGTRYTMPSTVYNQSLTGQTVFQGQLTSMNLPTGGRIDWVYEMKALPSPNIDQSTCPYFDNGVCWFIPTWSSVVGVRTRSLWDSQTHLVGTWQYTGSSIPAKWNEIINEVDFPPLDPAQVARPGAPPVFGHSIVTYYSACTYGVCLNESGGEPADTYAVDYGLPYSRRRPDGLGNFLSQEIYAGAVGSSPKLRQVFANYDSDEANNPFPGSATSPVFANQRPQSHRTVYLDDPVPGQPGNFTAIATASSGYDGLGHYRIAVASDNIGRGTSRTERTDWNPNPGGLLALSAPPGPTDSWILDTYDYKEQQEGAALIRQEARFDKSKGFFQCERRLATASTHGPNDVIVAYQPDPAGHGQVASEQWYGGDASPLSSGQDCGGPLPAIPAYTYSHFYSAGVRNQTTTQVTVNGVQTTLKLLDADIDAGSGLVSASRDPSGRATTYTYDPMGRPLSSTPPGAATTNVTYHLTPSPPSIERSVGSPALEDESWLLDGLGRTVQHTVTLPGNVPSTSFITLNAMGWKTLETEPSSSSGAKGTTYQGYDPFGRPAMIVAADGKPTYFTYHGVRAVVRTQRVWNGTREAPVNTTEEYDGLGRLRKVIEPDGTVTRYAYDPGGRLSMVTNNASGAYQTRTLHYDGRGFLTLESYPELGLLDPQKPGTYRVIRYHYDARGNLFRKETPTGRLLYGYDEAGRLRFVNSPPMTTNLRELSYGSGGTAGELVQASAFNWRTAAAACSDFEVRQVFSYEPSTGRLSSVDTSLWQGGALEHWTQSYLYDGADRITQVSYPTCSVCSSPARTVTTTYSLGRPTAVSGFANAITYNGNGTLATIQHANGVVFTETADPSGMPRPGSMRADLSSTELWQPESYFYDGAGNIKAIGAKSFVYDVNSRLVSATLPSAGAQPYQAFTYDALGNLVSIFRGANSGSGTSLNLGADSTTNRLPGGTYDNSGELTDFLPTAFHWTWDVLGQVTTNTTDSESWVHTYDAAGERVWSWRTSPSRLDTYALRGQDRKLLSLFTKTGSTYIWEDYAYREGMLLGAASSNGSVTHFDVDHLGSVRLETNGAAPLTQPKYRDFWPYGEEATPPGGSERMKFAGQERDLGNLTSTADDIDYMHARYFRSIWGRFLSPDPAGGSAEVPKSWNRYTYTVGNPIRLTDPSGKALLDLLTKAQQQVNAWLGGINSSFVGTVVGAATGASPILAGTSTALDLLKVGESTGTAVGSGAGKLDLSLAVARDALRALALAGGLAGLAGGIVPAAESETVQIFRAVDQAEMGSVLSQGTYGSSPSMTGKYFALTQEGAQNFAGSAINAGKQMTITSTTIPRSVFNQGYFYTDVGANGAGASIHFSESYLSTLYNSMTPITFP
jgi:RHS repeat-associated protein